ncbi:MAG: PelD GGDEF domain-containing protein [Desulfurobacteriaceae bacterium]
MFKDLGVKFVVVEVGLFFLLFTVLGYKMNPKDPFFIHSSVNPFILLLVVFTLYYGLMASLFFFVFLVLALQYIYTSLPLQFILWSLLITLICGEFHFYWREKISVYRERNRYLFSKLKELRKNFFLLKISHDQLESHYLVKPLSIRKILSEIKKKLFSMNDEEAIKDLMELISQVFHVQSASLYLKKGETYVYKASVGRKVQFLPDDPLVQKALESKQPVFVSSGKNTSYLAVIPIEDDALFLIKEMPFIQLNLENILSIAVSLNWFMKEKSNSFSLEKVPKVLRELPPEFLKEIKVTSELNRKFGIKSSLVIFKVPSEFEDFPFFLEEKVRGLDMVGTIPLKKVLYVFVLLPLSSFSNAKGFIERIKKELNNLIGISKVKHRIIDVDERTFEKLSKLVGERDGKS